MTPPASSFEAPAADTPLVVAVRTAIEQHGPSLLFEPVRLAELLSAQFPPPDPAVSLLLRALDEQVPQELLGLHAGDGLSEGITAVAERLGTRQSLAAPDARWAVQTWAEILHVVPMPAALPDPAPPLAATVPSSPVAERAAGPEAGAGRGDRRARGPLARVATVALVLLIACVAGGIVWFNFFQRSLAIASVGADGALVGDGSRHDVQVRFSARNVDVRGVEVRFVRGDVNGDAQPVWIAIAPTAAASRVAPAGQIGLASSHPSRATFSYVLVAADGTRSAPVEKTFDFAAGPVRPPVIRSVAVPGELVTGKPFVLTIAFDDGTSTVGTVEMKVVDGRGDAAAQTVTSRLTDLPASQPGTVTFPVAAAARPSRRTADFTLVDADGHRSAPARVVLDVRKAGFSPADCTAATCGRVLTARAVEPKEGLSGFFGRLFDSKERARPAYAIAVRFDNGSTRMLQASSRWNPGARVRVAGRVDRLHCIEPGDRCW